MNTKRSLFANIQKPNAFLMKIGFLCCFLSWVVPSLAFNGNYLFRSFVKIPTPLLYINAFMMAFPFSCLLLLIVFMPYYDDNKLSNVAKYTGIPLVTLFSLVILCCSFILVKGTVQYKTLFNNHYALQPTTLSHIEEIYATDDTAIIYVTSSFYPDDEVDERINLIAENFPVYILHFSIDDDAVSAYDVLDVNEAIQEPIIVVIINGEKTHCFFAQEIIDGNFEAHLRHWETQNRYFLPPR